MELFVPRGIFFIPPWIFYDASGVIIFFFPDVYVYVLGSFLAIIGVGQAQRWNFSSTPNGFEFSSFSKEEKASDKMMESSFF